MQIRAYAYYRCRSKRTVTMAINSINSTAFKGIQRGLQGMRRNAAEIASANTLTPAKFPTKDLVRAMVELHQNSQQINVSVKALKAADQMLGSLLDIKA